MNRIDFLFLIGKEICDFQILKLHIYFNLSNIFDHFNYEVIIL